MPYVQRAQEPEPVDPTGDRRRRVAAAERELGTGATDERIAEYLGISSRTVGRWRSDVRPAS